MADGPEQLRIVIRAMVILAATAVAASCSGHDNALAPRDAPEIIRVTPGSVPQGATASITVAGANFRAGATAVAVAGDGISVGTVTVLGDTALNVVITANPVAPLGNHALTITTPTGTVTWATFAVALPPTPVLNSITPDSGAAGSIVTATFAGNQFAPGGAYVLFTATGARTSAFVMLVAKIVDSTSATVAFSISNTTSPGVYTVNFETAGGLSNGVPFTVLPPAPQMGTLSATPATITAGDTDMTGLLSREGGYGDGSSISASPPWRVALDDSVEEGDSGGACGGFDDESY